MFSAIALSSLWKSVITRGRLAPERRGRYADDRPKVIITGRQKVIGERNDFIEIVT